MLNSHGGRVDQAAERLGCRPDDLLDLSTGVYPELSPDLLAQHLNALAPVIRRYPDPDGEPARSALAQCLGVPVERILLGAGAQAFIEIIFAAGVCKRLALREPCYVETRRCAERSSVEVVPWNVPSELPQGALAWVTSPHSLTGEWVSLPEIATSEGVVGGVLDESYASLAERQRVRLSDAWIRIGSLTKCFSMPGLRLGYAIASEAWIERLREYSPPWPAPTLALHLLPRLLPTWEERDLRMLEARRRLSLLLERADFEVRPSSASFVLARCRSKPPEFAQHRILVREFPEWNTLEGWMRFGIPAAERDWVRLERALCLRG